MISPEQAASWFFRLNGCLTINNFIVHDDSTSSQRTDVDIFAVRETNQSVVETALGLNGDWTDFAMKQWAVFMDLLEQLDPPAIVVPNAKASRILQDALKAGDMCEQSLCHFLRLNGRDVPIFFAGMLSGQHAMDVYSKARLEYVVRKKLCSMG